MSRRFTATLTRNDGAYSTLRVRIDAKAKAESLCKASGIKLGELLSIDYNWGELNIVSRTTYEMEDCVPPMMAMSKCAAPEIEPDDIEVSDTVAFVWEIQ